MTPSLTDLMKNCIFHVLSVRSLVAVFVIRVASTTLSVFRSEVYNHETISHELLHFNTHSSATTTRMIRHQVEMNCLDNPETFT